MFHIFVKVSRRLVCAPNFEELYACRNNSVSSEVEKIEIKEVEEADIKCKSALPQVKKEVMTLMHSTHIGSTKRNRATDLHVILEQDG